MKNYVEKIKRKYRTDDPLELAQSLNIVVLFEELGTINGYFNTAYRQKFVHLNSNLSESEMRLTLAHELGHALLHPTTNTYFLRSNTLLSVGRYEQEANLFAVFFLISDEELLEHRDFSTGQLSTLFGIPESLITLRLKN